MKLYPQCKNTRKNFHTPQFGPGAATMPDLANFPTNSLMHANKEEIFTPEIN